jgi:hypothetical protein
LPGYFPYQVIFKTRDGPVTILPAKDAIETVSGLNRTVMTTILDPWYNRGVGGTRPDYNEWLARLVRISAERSDHVFVWGFPEIVHRVLDHVPPSFSLLAWLTWYYKNCPSVIRGWRSAQYTCLHLAKEGARVYPEHFLNDVQLERKQQGKLRYIPGPPSVIEYPLNIGFVGRNEQTGHPAQKPEKVFEPLILMTTKPGDAVLDPFCGSGTTGVVSRRLGRASILCDESVECLDMTRKRLGLVVRKRTIKIRAEKVV